MPDPLFDLDDDANTPISAEEREQLVPSYITLRHELNEAEQVNVGAALRWAGARKRVFSPPFTWGRANLVNAGDTRARYVEALRAADNHDIGPLLDFARS